MLGPDRRQTERKARRDDQKIIVCLLAAFVVFDCVRRGWHHDLIALAGTGVSDAMGLDQSMAVAYDYLRDNPGQSMD